MWFLALKLWNSIDQLVEGLLPFQVWVSVHGVLFISHFFKMLLEMKVFSVWYMLWMVWKCLIYYICQNHSIKSLSQLYSYVPGRLQGNGVCKISMWGRYFNEIFFLLEGPHNWDRRADFHLTFSFPHLYYLAV